MHCILIKSLYHYIFLIKNMLKYMSNLVNIHNLVII